MDVYNDASRCHLPLLPTVPDVKLAAVANALEVGPAEASRVRSVVPVILWQCMETGSASVVSLQLFCSARVLVSAALRAGLSDTSSVASLFPGESLAMALT